MDEDVLEIRSHEGEGYKALVDFGSWRVAILRCENELLPGQQLSMERHLETDEVFMLIQGTGALILGGNGREVGPLQVHAMEIGKLYNVRKNGWHTVSLSRDASVLIVENRDTVRANSEYEAITQEQRQWIAEAADRRATVK